MNDSDVCFFMFHVVPALTVGATMTMAPAVDDRVFVLVRLNFNNHYFISR